MRNSTDNKKPYLFPALAGTACLVLLLAAVISAVPANAAGLRALSAAFHLSSETPASSGLLPISGEADCGAVWLSAQLAARQGNPSGYAAALACSPLYTPLVAVERPLDAGLAAQAVHAQPLDPALWFWLGQAQEADKSLSALDSYLKVLALDEQNGLAWCRLGFIYETQGNLTSSLDAFAKCCSNEDPGVNGCYGAGRVSEKLGDPLQAIQYYRMSRWLVAQQKADELEKSVNR